MCREPAGGRSPRGFPYRGPPMEAPLRYETFVHGADIGVRGRGKTLAEAFAAAALALTAVITDPSRVAPRVAVPIACEAPDDELLLVQLLDALIYESSTRGMLFSRFELRVEPGRVVGRAYGEPLDVARHEPAVEVKGATLTELRVRREPDGGWLAQCVVDV
jgi:SHS2 domain-containing protein